MTAFHEQFQPKLPYRLKKTADKEIVAFMRDLHKHFNVAYPCEWLCHRSYLAFQHDELYTDLPHFALEEMVDCEVVLNSSSAKRMRFFKSGLSDPYFALALQNRDYVTDICKLFDYAEIRAFTDVATKIRDFIQLKEREKCMKN